MDFEIQFCSRFSWFRRYIWPRVSDLVILNYVCHLKVITFLSGNIFPGWNVHLTEDTVYNVFMYYNLIKYGTFEWYGLYYSSMVEKNNTVHTEQSQRISLDCSPKICEDVLSLNSWDKVTEEVLYRMPLVTKEMDLRIMDFVKSHYPGKRCTCHG